MAHCDYSLCKGCGEIFPYRITVCPVCHSESVNLEEYRLEQVGGIYGGAVVKWFACIFMLTLVGLVAFTLSRNVSDERLLGRRDEIIQELRVLEIKKKQAEIEAVPAQELLNKAQALRDIKEKLELREKKLKDREVNVDEKERRISVRESRVAELSEIENQIFDRRAELDRLNKTIATAKSESANLKRDNGAARSELEQAQQQRLVLAEEAEKLSRLIASSGVSLTNLTQGAIAFEGEMQKLISLQGGIDRLKAEASKLRKNIDAGRYDYCELTNSVVSLQSLRARLESERLSVSNEVVRLRGLTNELAKVSLRVSSDVARLRDEQSRLVVQNDVAGRQKRLADKLEAMTEEAESQDELMSAFKKKVGKLDQTIGDIERDLTVAAAEAKKRLEAVVVPQNSNDNGNGETK